MRIVFAKTEAMRYTSHLDLHRTWERTIRRAGLPLAYSQGYNPRPRIQIAAALPLGFTSQHEIVDAWFDQILEPEEAHKAIQNAAPPGIQVLQVIPVDLRAPALQTQVESAEYIVEFLDRIADLNKRVEAIREPERLLRRRRGKDYDLRPLIEKIDLLPESDGTAQKLSLRLAAREGATGRPEEVLLEMGIPPHTTRVKRTELIMAANE